MRATIDKAGRLVLPKALRERVGITAGEVEVTVSGAGLHVEPVTSDRLAQRGGRVIVPRGGVSIDDETVRELRDADQR
jgi:AbrB family looped-hinge helix DNA binding protein